MVNDTEDNEESNLVQAKKIPVGKRNAFPMVIGKDDKMVFGLNKLEYMATHIASRIAPTGAPDDDYYIADLSIRIAKKILKLLEDKEVTKNGTRNKI